MVEDQSGNQTMKCVGTYKSPQNLSPIILNKQVCDHVPHLLYDNIGIQHYVLRRAKVLITLFISADRLKSHADNMLALFIQRKFDHIYTKDTVRTIKYVFFLFVFFYVRYTSCRANQIHDNLKPLFASMQQRERVLAISQ